MEIYCVKCKTKTPTLNPKFTVHNGKNMVKGLCTVCNKYKTSFVKGPQTGTGLNDITNKLPIELHL